jgi:hypothetical protein
MKFDNRLFFIVKVEVVMAVSMKNNIVWNVTPCSLYKFTNMSEEPAASIFRVRGFSLSYPEDGGNPFLQNVSKFPPE